MVKRFILMAIAAIFFFLQFPIHNANALELTEETRTVPLNEEGETITLTSEQITNGQRLFIRECTQCHLQGKTKTNNNVSLGLEDLSLAEPPRDNVLGLVDYLKYPTSYDGEDDYTELHVNVSRPDIYPELRDFTEDDLYDVSGYILVAPKLDSYWGGSIYF
ncbi:photosystem II extrinsic protein, cytochrome c550 [Crocosphaera subtropica ATCC 51142]|uniref:Photosystem II extrinsic protein V n=1 Tax=Crocosphaera subtropica (strain ATCC 51142 / BH68) TaxID=43989 RepID=B1WVX0_CROS5|nr:photosystem II extrinsic protein, cytochrome c550 [Crocosphaera subtropica ATCC 51142]